jgi:hypothetical protein
MIVHATHAAVVRTLTPYDIIVRNYLVYIELQRRKRSVCASVTRVVCHAYSYRNASSFSSRLTHFLSWCSYYCPHTVGGGGGRSPTTPKKCSVSYHRGGITRSACGLWGGGKLNSICFLA